MTHRELWGKPKGQYKNCCYCELTIPRSEITREHIIPKSRGGRITAPCCLKCNREKANMLLIDYIIYLWRELGGMRDPKKIKRTEVKIRNATKFILLLYPGEYDFIFK